MKILLLFALVMLLGVLSIDVAFAAEYVDNKPSTDGIPDSYLQLISVSPSGDPANNDNYLPSLSSNGQYIVFVSRATNLVENDRNHQDDIFVRDLINKKTNLVSIASDGTQGSFESSYPTISGDGRYVVFTTRSNLDSNDLNNNEDVYMHDQITGKTTWISAPITNDAKGSGFSSVISENGNVVVFSSSSSALGIDGRGNLFVWDNERKIISATGIDADDFDVSGNGRYIVFTLMRPTDIINEGNNGDLFVYDIETKKVTWISKPIDEFNAQYASDLGTMDYDGKIVVFRSSAPNLVSNDDNSEASFFLHDLTTSKTKLISIDENGEPFFANSHPDISSDGKFVLFQGGDGMLIYSVDSDKSSKVSSLGSAEAGLNKDGSLVTFTVGSSETFNGKRSEFSQVVLTKYPESTNTDSQIDDSITVTTDKTSYEDGDTIFVIGEVGEILSGYPVSLTIIAPNGNLVTKQQIDVGSDKQFSTEFTAGGKLMRDGGTYTIQVLYGTESRTDETTFTFGGSTTEDLPNEITINTTLGSNTPGCEDTTEGCFTPREASVALGGKVIFSNPDTASHTFTAGTAELGPSGEFDSGIVNAHASYEWTPTTEGEVPYFCMVHPWMAGTIFVGEGTYIPPQPEDNFDLQVIMGNSVYDLSDNVTMNLSISGISNPQNVALEISDPSGTTVISRSFMVDSQGVPFEFKIDENFKTGTYKVVVTTSDNGNTITDTAYFKVKSQYNSFKITSVQVTDQQGNPSNLQAGEIGFIKVNLDASKPITTLVTVNLFDSDLTSIGIGSIKTTLSSGNSEIILSFMIPNDVAVGQSNIYVNAFSDWPSNGGIPLTGEVSIAEDIK